MKKLVKISTIAASFVLLLCIASCEKDEGKKPNIAFKTTVGYTSSNVSLAAGTAVLVGINASKAEDKDVLKTYNVSKTVNGGASTSLVTTSLTGTQGDSYSADYPILVASTSGTVEVYTFTVTNRDGITNSVSLTVTTN